MVEAATIGARRGMRLVAEYARRIGEAMEHEMAMRQMRAHLARAGREIQSARQFLETPTRRGTNLANATASIDDAMDTIQQSLSERGGS
jgi:tRNA-dihydrouridine synthase